MGVLRVSSLLDNKVVGISEEQSSFVPSSCAAFSGILLFTVLQDAAWCQCEVLSFPLLWPSTVFSGTYFLSRVSLSSSWFLLCPKILALHPKSLCSIAVDDPSNLVQLLGHTPFHTYKTMNEVCVGDFPLLFPAGFRPQDLRLPSIHLPFYCNLCLDGLWTLVRWWICAWLSFILGSDTLWTVVSVPPLGFTWLICPLAKLSQALFPALEDLETLFWCNLFPPTDASL